MRFPVQMNVNGAYHIVCCCEVATTAGRFRFAVVSRPDPDEPDEQAWEVVRLHLTRTWWGWPRWIRDNHSCLHDYLHVAHRRYRDLVAGIALGGVGDATYAS